MKNYFIKTHYEHVSKYLKSIYPNAFKQEKLHVGDDPTYNDYCSAISDMIIEDNSDQIMRSYYNNLFFHLYHMQNCGEQIFYVTPELSVRLAQTICNSDVYFLKSPFREIFVQIDPGLFYINNINGDKIPLRGFYVYLRDLDNKKHIRVLASTILKPTIESPLRELSFYFHIEMNPNKIQDELQIYLEEDIKRKRAEQEKYDVHKNIDHIKEFATFVFNTLLYITSKNPDIVNRDPFDFDKKIKGLKSNKKKRKTERLKEKATTKRIIIVGTHIKDRNKDILNIKKAGGVGSWKLQHKVNVSAHWRTQWYGNEKKGTRHREQIWIDSYEKGPEYTDLITSKHIVK